MKKSHISKIKRYFQLCFPIKTGSTVVLTVSPSTDKELIDLLCAAVKTFSAKIKVLDCGDQIKPHTGVPDTCFDTLRAYSHWIDATTKGAFYTDLSKRYYRNGGHFLILSGMTMRGIMETVVKADIKGILNSTSELFHVFRRAKELRIVSAGGTDITAPITTVKVSFDKIRDQLMDKRGIRTRFYGCLAIPLDFDKMNGKLVIEDYIWPPETLKILEGPIALQIKNGKLVKSQKDKRSKILSDWIASFNAPSLNNISHLTLGTIPGVTLSDSVLINERISGALSFGLGAMWDECPTHIDMISTKSTIYLDSNIIQDKGNLLYDDRRKPLK